MGTNYYRIPKADRFQELKARIMDQLGKDSDYRFAENFPHFNDDIKEELKAEWNDEEGNELYVHLGKRSGGWKFLWNFHRNKFYSTKEELFQFIRNGRVFNEYGEEQDPEEFIQMALTWCPDGWDSETYPDKSPWEQTHWHDEFREGLRIASTTRESTYFA